MNKKLPSFAISFVSRKATSKKLNKHIIYARISVNNSRTEISTKRYVSPHVWDSKAEKMKGDSEEAEDLNMFLQGFRQRLFEIHTTLFSLNKPISADIIKQEYCNVHTEGTKCIIELFEKHNQQVEEKLDIDFAYGTLERYRVTLKHIKSFVEHKYNRDSFGIHELDYEFVVELEHYLKVTKGIGNNSTLKYIKNFKKIVLIALKHGWINKDPFVLFKRRLIPVERYALTKDELSILEAKSIAIARLHLVRNLFVFSCYTGLAFADAMKLTEGNIIDGVDGAKWLKVDRTKTKVISYIPLLPKAIEILELYKGWDADSNKLLPFFSNTKMNAYLKEIAAVCGINKHLHYHLARHTFATTITLANGVSIESVSAMLGHTDIKTTQVYSKVVQQKISDEIGKIKGSL